MLPKPLRQICPQCEMNMIVVAGFDRDCERQTFECLRCGHVETPAMMKQQRRAG